MTQHASNHEFDKLVAGHTDVDLVHLMLEFAGDAYPELDRVGCLLEFDHLGVACVDVGAGDRTLCLPDRLSAISRVLYETEGFHGNREDYYDPRNSYLNEVMARRRGIPISLGILYQAVAGRAGVKMFGVNLPGHFVIGCADRGEAWYVDPFTRGELLDREMCTRRVEDLAGQSGIVQQEHFRPATPQEIAARVLRNLKAAYAMQARWPAVLRVQKRLAALLPRASGEQRDLGLAYLQAGEPARALSVLERYVSDCPREQATAIAPSVQAARRMMAERN
jgi:regulator of sirC expression with transglutaminase-like and TPR domain